MGVIEWYPPVTRDVLIATEAHVHRIQDGRHYFPTLKEAKAFTFLNAVFLLPPNNATSADTPPAFLIPLLQKLCRASRPETDISPKGKRRGRTDTIPSFGTLNIGHAMFPFHRNRKETPHLLVVAMEGTTHVGISRIDDTGKRFGEWIYVPIKK